MKLKPEKQYRKLVKQKAGSLKKSINKIDNLATLTEKYDRD